MILRILLGFAVLFLVACSSDRAGDPSATVSINAGDPQPEPVPVPQAASGLKDRTWKLVQFDGKPPAFPTATLRIEGKRGFINSGCNSGQGAVKVGKSSLRFSDMGMTERGCPDAGYYAFEDAYAEAVFKANNYAVVSNRLTLTGGPVLEFEAP